MNSEADAITLYSHEHSIISLPDESRGVVIDASWKARHSYNPHDPMEVHWHEISCAAPASYVQCGVKGKTPLQCDCWRSEDLRATQIRNANGDMECFYCVLVREVPYVKFLQIQGCFCVLAERNQAVTS